MCQIRDRLQPSDVVPLLWARLSFPWLPKAKVTPSPPVIDLNLQLFASLKGNLVEIKTGTLDGCKTCFPSLEAYETPALSSCPCRLL